MAGAEDQNGATAAVRVGRRALGSASVLVDADALTVVLTGDTKKTMRLPLTAIAAIALETDGLHIVLADGKALTLGGESAPVIHDRIGGRCRAIPELTRGLRALGSSRAGATALEEQHRFFAPLLMARGGALRARAAADALAAFDARVLRAAIDDTLREFVTARFRSEGPHRRALQAELDDATEALRAALNELATAAGEAQTNADDFVRWRRWATQLRVTFEIADRAWTEISRTLAAAPPGETSPRGSIALST